MMSGREVMLMVLGIVLGATGWWACVRMFAAAAAATSDAAFSRRRSRRPPASDAAFKVAVVTLLTEDGPIYGRVLRERLYDFGIELEPIDFYSRMDRLKQAGLVRGEYAVEPDKQDRPVACRFRLDLPQQDPTP